MRQKAARRFHILLTATFSNSIFPSLMKKYERRFLDIGLTKSLAICTFGKRQTMRVETEQKIEKMFFVLQTITSELVMANSHHYKENTCRLESMC